MVFSSPDDFYITDQGLYIVESDSSNIEYEFIWRYEYWNYVDAVENIGEQEVKFMRRISRKVLHELQ